jgi:hypothetical protein
VTLVSFESTTLNLLLRDGDITVTFTPALDSDMYVELLDVVAIEFQEHALKVQLTKLAQEWNRAVRFDAV